MRQLVTPRQQSRAAEFSFLFLFIQSRTPTQEKAWPTVVELPTLVTLTQAIPAGMPRGLSPK